MNEMRPKRTTIHSVLCVCTIFSISLIIFTYLKYSLFVYKWLGVCVYVYESEHECVICSPCEYAIFGVLFQKSIYIYEKKSERHTTGKMIIVCFVVRCKWAVCGASRAGSVFGFSSHKRYYSLPIYMQRDRHTNTKKRAAEERNKQTHKQNMNWQRCNALQQWQWSVIDFLILCLRTGAGAYSHYC